MGTLTGDLLRLLAHGVANTGSAYLGQLLTTPIKANAEAKLLGVKKLIEAGGTIPEEAAGPWSEAVQRVTGIKWPTYQAPTGNVIGPEGEKLAMTPVAGAPVTPELAEKLVRSPAGIGEVLGAALQRSPGMIPQALGIKTGTEASAGQLLKDTQTAAAQEIQRTRDEANQQLRAQGLQQQAGLIDAKKEAMGHAVEASLAKINLATAEHDRKVAEGQTKAADTAANAVRKTLTSQLNSVMKATDPNVQGALADQYNAQLQEAQGIHGEKLGDLKPLPVITKETWFGYGEPKRRLGAEVVPSTPSATVPAATEKAAPTWTNPQTGISYTSGQDVGNGKKIYFEKGKWTVR